MAFNAKLFIFTCALGALTVSLWRGAPTQTVFAAAPGGDDVKQVFLDKCSVCHGEDGAGKTAKGRKLKVKDVRSPEVQKMTDADLMSIVLNGKGTDMDGFEKELGKDMCQKLAVYMRSLAKN